MQLNTLNPNPHNSCGLACTKVSKFVNVIVYNVKQKRSGFVVDVRGGGRLLEELLCFKYAYVFEAIILSILPRLNHCRKFGRSSYKPEISSIPW